MALLNGPEDILEIVGFNLFMCAPKSEVCKIGNSADKRTIFISFKLINSFKMK